MLRVVAMTKAPGPPPMATAGHAINDGVTPQR